MADEVDEALEDDLNNDVENGNKTRRIRDGFNVDLIGRKPFALNYVSLFSDTENEDENISNIIAAFDDEDFKNQYPLAAQAAQDIINILNAYRSDTITKDEAKSALSDLQNNEQSYKTRARLARTLFLAGNCSYRVELRKIPDMSWLIPQNLASNFYQRDADGHIVKDGKDKRVTTWKRDRSRYENMPTSPAPVFDQKHIDRLISSLQDRRNELALQGVRQDILDFYDWTIEAYVREVFDSSTMTWHPDWTEISQLNDKITTMDHVTAAFDIREHTGFAISAPDYYMSKTLDVESNVLTPPPPLHDDLNSLTSDEWMQMLNVGAEAAYNRANSLTEGLVIASLREVKGDDFANLFADEEMTLDNKEDLLKHLNPAELSKFNMALLKRSETLAEMLPPHFITMMAKRVDEALENDSLEDTDKNSLTQQKAVLLEAMVQTVEDYERGVELNVDNAAGVYDGAVEMAQYLADNLAENKDEVNTIRAAKGLPALDDDAIKTSLDSVFLKDDSVLNKAIKEYDSYHYLDEVTEKTEKNIAKSYKHLSKKADKLVQSAKFEEDFNRLLDDDTKQIFESLEFPSAEDKKDFMSAVVYMAIQQAATCTAGKKKKVQEAVFNEIINETVIEETLRLVQAEDAVQVARGGVARADDIYVTDNLSYKKTALIAKLASNVPVSTDAMAGYFANVVNRQSIWVDRLASKIKNRAAPVLQKMWKPFQKLDQTCIARFGKSYQAARGIFKQSLTNLPWSIANAAVRVAAFSQIGTPWGAACVGCYAAYSFGSTLVRMEMQRRRLKKEDPNNPSLKAGKFFLKNLDGIALSAVGTSLSCIPGLASGIEVLKPAVSTMKDLGLMNVSSLGGANFLGMTNASLGLTGLGVLDSAIKGVRANRKLGNSWLKSIGDSLGISVLSSASGIATGYACGQFANHMFDNMGFNKAADIRTVTNEVKDDGFREDSPNHDPDADYAHTHIENGDIRSGLDETAQKTFDELIQNIDNARDEASGVAAVHKMEEFLNSHGMSVTEISRNEDGNFSIHWKTPGHSGYTEGAVEHAAERAADWQKDVPGLHEANIEAIKGHDVITKFNEAHPTMAVDPNRMEMILMESGAQAVPANQDTHQIVHHDGHMTDVRGNHRVITDAWVDKYGNNEALTKYCDGEAITKEDIAHLRSLHNPDGSFNTDNVTERDLKVINALDHIVSDQFEVGDLEQTRDHAIGEKYLPSITAVNESGEHVNAEDNNMKADRFNTYANANSARDDTEPVPHERSYAVDKYSKTNHYFMAINPSVDLYTFVKKVETKLSKIMGNHGKKQDKQILKPLNTAGRV